MYYRFSHYRSTSFACNNRSSFNNIAIMPSVMVHKIVLHLSLPVEPSLTENFTFEDD
jgi:hypothetical protein